MSLVRSSLLFVAIATGLMAVTFSAAAADVFDFIPSGGRTLLANALAGKPAPAEIQGLIAGKHDAKEWLAYLKEHRKALAPLRRMSDKELTTLADYLSFNMPLAAGTVPVIPARANWAKILPPDGRDFALDYCQSCHIITVVITQDRAKSAWLGTMHKPSHIGIKLTEKQRDALATYLIVNAAIPIDKVPEELRAGGATY